MREEYCVQCGAEYAIFPRQPEGLREHPFCSAKCRAAAVDYAALLEEATKGAIHLREQTPHSHGIHPFAVVIRTDGRLQRVVVKSERSCTFAEAANRIRTAARSAVAEGTGRAAAVVTEVCVRQPNHSNAFQIEMEKPDVNPVTFILAYRLEEAAVVLGERIVLSGERPVFGGG
jgi:hypothetical protein